MFDWVVEEVDNGRNGLGRRGGVGLIFIPSVARNAEQAPRSYTQTQSSNKIKKPKNTKEKATNVVVLSAIKQDQMVMEEDVGN